MIRSFFAFQQKLQSLAVISGSATAVFVGASIYNGNDHFYSNFLMPALHRVTDGEQAHRLAVLAAKKGFFFPGRQDKAAPTEPRVQIALNYI